MKDIMQFDQIQISFDDVEKIKHLAQQVDKVNLAKLPFHEGTLYVEGGEKESFAIYFNMLLLDFKMYIPSVSTVIPSMEFKMNFDKGDLFFYGDVKRHWNKHKKGKEMMGTYYLWCIASFVYLLNPSLYKGKIDLKVVQKV